MDGTNPCVIVAIPSRTDNVWQMSSEKIPHLTILALDRKEALATSDRISEYLEHVANTSLHRFTLFVENRDTLGDNEADVLLFSKNYSIRQLVQARSYLLQNADISKAYNSMPQFPSWLPHLTMGYPKSPAKSDRKHHIENSWVEFDRIALWTGDYEGPEFKLKSNEREVSMSDSVNDFLSHYGVKGMKWGVRGSNSSASSVPASDDSRRATEVLAKAKVGGTKSLSNKDLQDLNTRMNLEQQYARLAPADPRVKNGKTVIEGLRLSGRTMNEVMAFVNSPAGKLIRKAAIGV